MVFGSGGSDLHTALKAEVAAAGEAGGIGKLVLVRAIHGKDAIRYGLHVQPSTWSTAGVQTTDFLARLGFHRGECAFVGGECYARGVGADFDLNALARVLPQAFQAYQAADRSLSACGIFLPHSHGWGYFFGQPSRPPRAPDRRGGGDGHHAAKSERLKESEDDYFSFVLTWIQGGSGEGWATHYQPMHPPLSPEMAAAFASLGLNRFDSCPEFEFEPCSWLFTRYERSDDSPFGGNAGIAHGWFDAHPGNFSEGIEQLLAVQLAVRPFGMQIFPDRIPGSTPARDVVRTPSSLTSTAASSPDVSRAFDYDVAVSFAGPNRALAERLAVTTREAGFRVFYDDFYPEQLWGKDLPVFFDEIYRLKSRYCVVFVSAEYRDRMWTNHERKSAIARAMTQKEDYLLPVKVDASDLPGLPPTTGYLSLIDRSIDEIASLLVKKLEQAESRER